MSDCNPDEYCEYHEEPPAINADAIKNWAALQYEQAKRLAPALSLGMMTTITTLTVAGWLYDKPWAGAWLFPAIFAAILGAIVAVPWFYYHVLGMKHAEREAWRTLDPYQDGKLTPKEQRLIALFVAALEGDAWSRAKLREASKKGHVHDENPPYMEDLIQW